MTRLTSAKLARNLETLFDRGTLAYQTDSQLLQAFVADGHEAAFEQIIARHGPLVLRICRRSLDDPHDIEDAFQATFLILVRKARTLRDQTALANWLHGVAARVARRARANAYRRHHYERKVATGPVDRSTHAHPHDTSEIAAILDEEIRGLPENQQRAVLLCLRDRHNTHTYLPSP